MRHDKGERQKQYYGELMKRNARREEDWRRDNEQGEKSKAKNKQAREHRRCELREKSREEGPSL